MKGYFEEIKRQDKLIDSLVKVLPNGKQGNVAVGDFTVDEEDVKRVKMESIFGGSYEEYHSFKPGTYKRLVVNNKTMMSTTQMERETNRAIMRHSNGHVFIAGLGLGMILLPIQEKSNVESITVVEYNENVIDLVGKKLPLNKKVEIIHCDVFNYKPNRVFDTVYFDIWTEISSDNWDGMKMLTSKFKNKINRDNPEHIITSWRKNDVQRMVRQDKIEKRNRQLFDSIFNGHRRLMVKE